MKHSSYFVPGTLLGMEHAKTNKAHLCPQSVHRLVKDKHINKELVYNDRRGFCTKDNGSIKVHEAKYCNFVFQLLFLDLDHLKTIFM